MPPPRFLRLAAAALLGGLAVAVESASLRRRRFVLDSGLGRIQVQTAVLDVLVNSLGRLQEGLFHVFSSGDQRNKGQEGNRNGTARHGERTHVFALASRNSKPEGQEGEESDRRQRHGRKTPPSPKLTVLVGELFGLLVRHVPLSLQVGLVPDQNDHLKGTRRNRGQKVIRPLLCFHLKENV